MTLDIYSFAFGWGDFLLHCFTSLASLYLPSLARPVCFVMSLVCVMVYMKLRLSANPRIYQLSYLNSCNNGTLDRSRVKILFGTEQYLSIILLIIVKLESAFALSCTAFLYAIKTDPVDTIIIVVYLHELRLLNFKFESCYFRICFFNFVFKLYPFLAH